MSWFLMLPIYISFKTKFRALCQKLDIHLICVVDHIHTHYALKVYLVFVFDEIFLMTKYLLWVLVISYIHIL